MRKILAHRRNPPSTKRVSATESLANTPLLPRYAALVGLRLGGIPSSSKDVIAFVNGAPIAADALRREMRRKAGQVPTLFDASEEKRAFLDELVTGKGHRMDASSERSICTREGE